MLFATKPSIAARLVLVMIAAQCCVPSRAIAQYESATTFAPAIETIVIDGKLDDWPGDMQHHPVLCDFSAYGLTDLFGTDLMKSADLSPRFMTAYSPSKQLIYLAVMVRDDVHIVGHTATTTDAIEVYVDGNYLKADPPAKRRRDESPQYVGVAGDGAYYDHNPALMNAAPPADSGIAFAHSRAGDVTVYEFALRAYERYPNQYAKLEPGKRVGFEVVVVDRDGADDAAGFIAWSTPGALKHFDARLLGDMVFVEADALRTVRGRVMRGDTDKPYAGAIIDARGADGPAGFTVADEDGRFSFQMPPGDYTLRPARGQGIMQKDGPLLHVVVDEQPADEIALHFEPLAPPAALANAITRYAAMQSYRDQTMVEVRFEPADGNAMWAIVPLRFTFAQPNKLVMESNWQSMGQPRVTSDGGRVVTTAHRKIARGPSEAPDQFDALSLSEMAGPVFATIVDTKAGGDTWSFSAAPLATGLLPHRMMLASLKADDLLRQADSVSVVGPGLVDGQAATVLQIQLPTLATAPKLGYGDGLGGTTVWRLWIGDDGLIYKSQASTNIIKHSAGPQLPDEAQPRLTLTATHRRIEVDAELPDETFALPIE